MIDFWSYAFVFTIVAIVVLYNIWKKDRFFFRRIKERLMGKQDKTVVVPELAGEASISSRPAIIWEKPLCYLPGIRECICKIIAKGSTIMVEDETNGFHGKSMLIPGELVECHPLPINQSTDESGDSLAKLVLTSKDEIGYIFSVIDVTGVLVDASLIKMRIRSTAVEGATRIAGICLNEYDSSECSLILANDSGNNIHVLSPDLRLQRTVVLEANPLLSKNLSLDLDLYAYNGKQVSYIRLYNEDSEDDIAIHSQDAEGDLASSFFTGNNYPSWQGFSDTKALYPCILYDGANIVFADDETVIRHPMPNLRETMGKAIFVTDDGVYYAIKDDSYDEFIVQKLFNTPLKPLFYGNLVFQASEIGIFLDEEHDNRLHLVVISSETSKHLAIDGIKGKILDCWVTTLDRTLVVHTTEETIEISELDLLDFRIFWRPIQVDGNDLFALHVTNGSRASAPVECKHGIYENKVMEADSSGAQADDFKTGL